MAVANHFKALIPGLQKDLDKVIKDLTLQTQDFQCGARLWVHWSISKISDTRLLNRLEELRQPILQLLMPLTHKLNEETNDFREKISCVTASDMFFVSYFLHSQFENLLQVQPAGSSWHQEYYYLVQKLETYSNLRQLEGRFLGRDLACERWHKSIRSQRNTLVE